MHGCWSSHQVSPHGFKNQLPPKHNYKPTNLPNKQTLHIVFGNKDTGRMKAERTEDTRNPNKARGKSKISPSSTIRPTLVCTWKTQDTFKETNKQLGQVTSSKYLEMKHFPYNCNNENASTLPRDKPTAKNLRSRKTREYSAARSVMHSFEPTATWRCV